MSRKKWSPSEGIEFETEEATEEALSKMERARSQRARLLKVAEIPQLKAEADALLDLFPDFKVYTARAGIEYEHQLIESQIATLEQRAVRWQLAPKTWRDDQRQAGTRKKRQGRWPALDRDIRAALEANPRAKARDIFDNLPDSFEGASYYVDGDEIVGPNGRTLGFGGFEKRVSKIGKEIKDSH